MMVQLLQRSTRGAGLFRPATGSAGIPASDPILTTYLDDIGRIPLLEPAEELALAQRIEAGDPEARDLLVAANLRLVVSIAKHYADHGVDLHDLIQEGNLGLLRAVARYNWRRGRFATYASWWIRQALTQALTSQSRTIRLPARMSERVRRVRRVAREMAQTLGREPQIDELAQALHLRPRLVIQALQVSQTTTSLDPPVTDTLDDTRALIQPASGDGPEEQLVHEDEQRELVSALALLSPTEYQVINLCVGLNGGAPQTIVAVAARLGLSRETIRQIRDRALLTLRRALMESEHGPTDAIPAAVTPSASRIAYSAD